MNHRQMAGSKKMPLKKHDYFQIHRENETTVCNIGNWLQLSVMKVETYHCNWSFHGHIADLLSQLSRLPSTRVCNLP